MQGGWGEPLNCQRLKAAAKGGEPLLGGEQTEAQALMRCRRGVSADACAALPCRLPCRLPCQAASKPQARPCTAAAAP